MVTKDQWVEPIDRRVVRWPPKTRAQDLSGRSTPVHQHDHEEHDMHIIENFLTLMLAERDDEGATAVEYGLLVALIAVAIIGTVGALGGKLNDLFTQIAGAL